MADSVLIVTGERGIGKSTVCRRTVSMAQAQGLACCGFITERRSADTLDVVDVRSGETRRLTVGGKTTTELKVGPYRFDPVTVAWGNTLLRDAPPCDLLVVDELGPLEFEQGRGWTAAFELIRDSPSGLVLVVVRPSLVERARAVLHAPVAEALWVTARSRDRLPAEILSRVRQV